MALIQRLSPAEIVSRPLAVPSMGAILQLLVKRTFREAVRAAFRKQARRSMTPYRPLPIENRSKGTQPKGDRSMIAKFRKPQSRLRSTMAFFAGLVIALAVPLGLPIRAGAASPEAEANEGDNIWDLAAKLQVAEGGNKWAAYDLWDAYAHGKHGVQPNATQAEKWLNQVVQDASVARFGPVDRLAPTS